MNTNLSSSMLNDFESSSRRTPPQSSFSAVSPCDPTTGIDEREDKFFRLPRSNRSVEQSESTPEMNGLTQSSSGSQDDRQSPISVSRGTSPSVPNIDYSFREADLYYGRPRRVSFHQASNERAPEEPSLTFKEKIIRVFLRI